MACLVQKAKPKEALVKEARTRVPKSNQNQPPVHAPSFAWICTHCNASVDLRHQWCGQCGRHWEDPDHEPERERAAIASGSKAKSGTDEKKNK